MTCWEALGETARAVRHYEELTALLRAEVKVAPAAETTALYTRLLGDAEVSHRPATLGGWSFLVRPSVAVSVAFPGSAAPSLSC
jgi:hypothetical protein